MQLQKHEPLCKASAVYFVPGFDNSIFPYLALNAWKKQILHLLSLYCPPLQVLASEGQNIWKWQLIFSGRWKSKAVFHYRAQSYFAFAILQKDLNDIISYTFSISLLCILKVLIRIRLNSYTSSLWCISPICSQVGTVSA